MSESPQITMTISSGDPSGIGPEVTAKALADEQTRTAARWIVVGESWLFAEISEQYGLQIDQVVTDVSEIDSQSQVILFDAQELDRNEWTVGEVSQACGKAGLAYVRIATELCIDGTAGGIVTAPLNKEAVALTGIEFCGHTEYIAELCGKDESRMLLVNDRLCVVHVSTHCSLAAATNLSVQRIERTIQLGHDAMRRLGFAEPRLCICGLNPHAGENGMFGNEEQEFILPAVERVQSQGIDCTGPFPADTLFMQAVRGKCDMVIAMYHDQGHVPMKLMDFEHTVNVTLGLPIIRTSVDHGTAFDIAGQGIADASDMKEAMQLAISLAQPAVIEH